MSAARNQGLKKVSAPYVAFLDSDDLWEPTKLEKQIQCFIQCPWKDLGVVYCAHVDIDEHDRVIIDQPTFQLILKCRGKITRELINGNKVASSTSGALLKTECLKKVGGFRTDLKIGEDWELWIRISQHYSFDYVNEFLVKVRRHSQNASNNFDQMFQDTIKVLKLFLSMEPRFSLKIKWRMKYWIANEIIRKYGFVQGYSWLKQENSIQSITQYFFNRLIIIGLAFLLMMKRKITAKISK